MIGSLREAMKQPVERKLAAILAADVAGYSRLMGMDEEGTHERLRAHLRDLVGCNRRSMLPYFAVTICRDVPQLSQPPLLSPAE
jgi:hypothetical protein